jgi:hypothetical protein
MQLPTAGCIPVEPHRSCCGLHSLLSARKRQLTYSFCYWQCSFPSGFFVVCFIVGYVLVGDASPPQSQSSRFCPQVKALTCRFTNSLPLFIVSKYFKNPFSLSAENLRISVSVCLPDCLPTKVVHRIWPVA